MIVASRDDISTDLNQLLAVGAGQWNRLTNLMNFCQKTSSNRTTPIMMLATSAKPKREGN
jgi:hypothetical protein